MKLARLADYLAIVAVMVLASGIAGWASQGGSAAVDKNPIVNLEMKNTPIKDAIDTLFQGRGLKYTVDPTIVGKVVELKLKDVTFKQALDALCEAAGLSYSEINGVYEIGPTPVGGVSRPTTVIVQSGTRPQAPPAQQTPAPQAQAAPEQEQPAEGAQESPAEEQKGQTVNQTGPQSGEVIVSQNASPIYYLQPSYPGYGGYGPYGGYPYTQVGNVGFVGGGWGTPVLVGGPSLYWFRDAIPPPPPGYVNAEVQRFLQTQYAIKNRQFVWPIY